MTDRRSGRSAVREISLVGGRPERDDEAPVSGLPVQRSRLIGRARELAEVVRLLLREDVGLVTLTGTGGSGKTRLALAVANELAGQFEDGVAYVALAAISEPDLVSQAICDALGVRDAGGTSLAERLEAYLREKQLLLVLDNFEQVVEAAPLTTMLLASCLGLKVLVTSRAVLHVSDEYDVPVPPLGLPERRAPSHQERVSEVELERLAQCESVQLFVERARAARSDFALTVENAPAVGEICHRLDGLPLAIELAAARSRLLPPRALLARLEQRLPVLTGGPRDVPARQRTLRDTIAWSYGLLRPEERALFRSLAVFAGGCTLDAIDRVASSGLRIASESVPHSRLAPHDSLLDLVGSLVDKSLLRREDRDDGEPRFTMLETIREYGLEQLEASGEGESVRQRHARYFLGLTDEPWRGLAGAETVAWLDRVEREHDNLRAALGWLRDHGPLEAGLSLSASLWWFWSVRGYLTEGQVWLRTFLDRPDPGTTAAPERARALFGAGVLARLQTDYEGSQALLEEALGIARANGDDLCAADVLVELGDVAYSRQAFAIARVHLAEALAIRRRVGDPWGTVDALNRLARVMLREGAFAEAGRGLKEARTLAEVVGARDLLAAAMYYAGEVASEIGEWSAAQHDYAEALRLFRDLGYHRWIARAMEGLAGLAAIQHDSVRALRLAGAAAAIRETSGQPLAPIEGHRLERRLGTIRAALDQRSAAAAWEAGRVQPLREAIEEALTSSAPPARTGRADVVAMPVRPDRSAGLSPREREVAVLIARGYSNGRIGDELALSRRTVESVVTAIFNKLGLSSRAEVAVWAVEHGLHATGPA